MDVFRMLILAVMAMHVKSDVCHSFLRDETDDGNLPDPSSVLKHTTPSGYSQCIRECARHSDCWTVSYTRETLTCRLVRFTNGTSVSELIMVDDGSCSGVVCNAGTMCVALTQGGYRCVALNQWCPTYIGERCYTLSQNVITWSQAKAECEMIGYTLAKIDSTDLMMALASDFPDGTVAFVGATFINEDGQWFWTDGHTSVDLHKIPHYLENQDQKACLTINFVNSPQLENTWCHECHLYICQSPRVN